MSKFTPEMKDNIVQLMWDNDKKTNLVCGELYSLRELYKMKLIDRLDFFNRVYSIIRDKFYHFHVSVSSFDCCLKAYIGGVE